MARNKKYAIIAPAIQLGINLLKKYYEKSDLSVVAAISTGKLRQVLHEVSRSLFASCLFQFSIPATGVGTLMKHGATNGRNTQWMPFEMWCVPVLLAGSLSAC